MKKVKLALIATAAIFCFACGNKTDIDFSIVPIKGANEEYQYIDIPKKGKIVINPQFERAHLFRGDLALVKTNGTDGKWGYIDKKGKFIIAPIYSKAQDFSDDVAWVQLENQPPMLIDKKGKMLLQIDSLIAALPFNKGIAGILVYSRGQELTMFIDKKGNPEATVAVANEFAIPIMKDGMYIFQDKATEKFGYKNKNGEIIINAQFDRINFFIDGMTTILSGKKWGAIDKNGDFIVNPQYDSLKYDGNGLFLAKVGKKWGWVNKKNEITINPQFDLSTGFSGSKLAPVQMGNKWGYIDREGQIIINPQFHKALPFNGNYAMIVDKENKAGFIDKTGNFVVSPMYDLSIDDVFEYIWATEQNLYGLHIINADFDMYSYTYERLEEKKEEERERAIAAASGNFTDSRDNKTYKTIKIGTQTWMAQNLNYHGEDGYLGLCYGDKPREQIRKPENCDIYGRLYDWSEAMSLNREYNWKKFSSDDTVTVQGVCPQGWHLPSKEEWQTLVNFAGGDNVAGKKLKARNGWNKESNGTDEFGFSALPGGFFSSEDGKFYKIGEETCWWNSSEYNSNNAYRWGMDSKAAIGLYYRNKSRMNGVRCVKD